MPGPASAASKRLFFALWPSEEFRAEVAASTAAIARASGGRGIPPCNFHVTLVFLGDVLQSRLDVVQLAGAAAAHLPTFELSFDRVETWGRKVLCLTGSAHSETVAQLAGKLRESVGDDPLFSEHEFRPHITLARDLPRTSAPEAVKPVSMQVKDFVLVESQRDSRGSNYFVIGRWPLLTIGPALAPIADSQ